MANLEASPLRLELDPLVRVWPNVVISARPTKFEIVCRVALPFRTRLSYCSAYPNRNMPFPICTRLSASLSERIHSNVLLTC